MNTIIQYTLETHRNNQASAIECQHVNGDATAEGDGHFGVGRVKTYFGLKMLVFSVRGRSVNEPNRGLLRINIIFGCQQVGNETCAMKAITTVSPAHLVQTPSCDALLGLSKELLGLAHLVVAHHPEREPEVSVWPAERNAVSQRGGDEVGSRTSTR